MANTWPGGHRHAMSQADHEKWNMDNYPGTLQLCSQCDEPTGFCEEDALWDNDGEPLCTECYDKREKRSKDFYDAYPDYNRNR